MNYWLMKSEPDVFSFEDLKACPKKTEHWDGIRNYQARNIMRDDMKKGDIVLFYHSNAGPETGVSGIAQIA
ncbi:MAG: EVE domain-containing protein, partial [Verrucomicrobiota bacterium]